ncbi:leucine-rich repeat and death domain-containing protein 1-like [Acanthaster planci]|uniref:Leucine-rich repeat and death domain-containing protein 1-like n=1 Tax=Acanthaster planci TaxID=133434 RepID=A0A8B7ZW60_ACAPL|nr:leucine-rich repeat and death domain-containing protein 1-like [Acanthaster planci]
MMAASDSDSACKGFFVTTDLPKDEVEQRTRRQEWDILASEGVKSSETLSLSSCNLCRLPPEILEMRDLTRLYLTYNDLDELPVDFNQLKNLKILNLGFNSFRHIPPVIFELKNLAVLTMKNNQVTQDQIGKDISQLTTLEEIYLDNNKLEAFPEKLCDLPRLRILKLSNNAIRQIPESISKMKTLQSLNMQSNRLTAIPKTVGELQSLETACFAQNMIHTFPFQEVKKLKRLRDLCLYANRLTDRDDIEWCMQLLAKQEGMLRAEENRCCLPRLGGVCDGPFKVWKHDILWICDNEENVKSWVNKMVKKLEAENFFSAVHKCKPGKSTLPTLMRSSRIVCVVCTKQMFGRLDGSKDPAEAIRSYLSQSPEHTIMTLAYEATGIHTLLMPDDRPNVQLQRKPDDDGDSKFFSKLLDHVKNAPRIRKP